MDDAARQLEAARGAYHRRGWTAARAGLTAARAAGELVAADLDALGDAAWSWTRPRRPPTPSSTAWPRPRVGRTTHRPP